MALTERLALLIDARVDGAVKDIKGLAKESARTDSEAKKLEKRGQAIGTAWKLGAGVVAGAALVKFGQLAGDAVDDASALAEVTNKVGVVFGSQAQKVLAFGENAAESIGQSKEQALSAAATFGQFFDAAGMAADAGSDMSLVMVKLASDMASFNDADPSEVLENLRSGLSGEAEPLRKFGVFLNESAVAAKAAELGLEGVNGKLTDGQKIQARYALILDQTSKAQGDFARTADGLANKQRTAAAMAEDASAALGEGLLPAQLALTNAFVEAAPAITAVARGAGGLVKAFTDLPGPVQVLIGGTTALAGGYLLLAPRIAETRQALKDLGAQAPRTAGALSAVGKAAAAFTVVLALDAALDALNDTMDKAGPTASELGSALLDMAEGKASDLPDTFDNLGTSVDNLSTKTNSFLDGITDSIPIVSGLDSAITGLIPGVNSGREAMDNAEKSIAKLDETLSGLSPEQAEAAFAALVRAQGLSEEQQKRLLALLPRYREMLAGAANQSRDTAGATEEMGAAAGVAAKQQDKLAEKLRQSRSEARSTAGEFLEFGDTLDDAEVSLRSWIRSMARQANALANFQANAERAADRGLRKGLIAALEDAGPAGALRMRQLANATDTEIARANRAWQRGQNAMKDYVAFKVPPKKVDVDTAPALRDIADVKRELSQIPDETVNINVHRNSLGGGRTQARASGGPVKRGEPYIVGEEGEELFIPDTNGRIVPNDRLRARGGRGGAGSKAGEAADRFGEKLRKATKATEKRIRAELDAAKATRDTAAGRLQALKEERAGFASAFGSTGGVFGSGLFTVGGILRTREAQAKDAVALNQGVKSLIGKGVSEDVLRELAAGGAGGLAQIQALVGASADQIAQFNRLTRITGNNLSAAGLSVGGALLDDDIASAQRQLRSAQIVAREIAKELAKVLDRQRRVENHQHFPKSDNPDRQAKHAADRLMAAMGG